MRILFVKTSSLGDVIHHCPAVTDTIAAFPNAVIDWVVERPFAAIAKLHPSVRRVIPVAIRQWRKQLLRPTAWRELVEFRRTLRDDYYDLVVDTQGLLKSALISAQALGVRHGFDAASAREPVASSFYQRRHHVDRALHAVERNRALTGMALGVAVPATFDYGLKPPSTNPIELSTAYCVLLTMTSRADKLWPERNWIEVVRALAGLAIESVLPWGNETERTRCNSIVRQAGSGIVPRSMSLDELASGIASARVVIGVDTGLSHLAAALKVPTVGIYCGSDPGLTGLYAGGNLSNLGGVGRPPGVLDVINAAQRVA